MNRLLLMRIVSIIHFLKCARTSEFSKAESSFEHCSYLKGFITLGLDEAEGQICTALEYTFRITLLFPNRKLVSI